MRRATNTYRRVGFRWTSPSLRATVEYGAANITAAHTAPGPGTDQPESTTRTNETHAAAGADQSVADAPPLAARRNVRRGGRPPRFH